MVMLIEMPYGITHLIQLNRNVSNRWKVTTYGGRKGTGLFISLACSDLITALIGVGIWYSKSFLWSLITFLTVS